MESDDGELYRLELRNSKKVFTKSRQDPSKGTGGGKGKRDRALVTSEQIAEPKLPSTGDPRNLGPKGKVLEIAEDEGTDISQNVPFGTIDLGVP